MVDEKEVFVNEVCMKLGLSDADIRHVRNVLFMKLRDYSISKITETEVVKWDEGEDEMMLRIFFTAKKVSGCTDRTLRYYQQTLESFLQFIKKPIKDIDQNDIRYYLAVKKERDHNSDVSVNNIRRNMSSFFGWIFNEGLIQSNPMTKVDKIRVEKFIKKAFTDFEIERLRNGIETLYEDKIKSEKKRNIEIARNRAIFEMMLSTGARMMEIVALDRQDVEGDEITVYGKGKKERVVYLNAKARIALDNYLVLREDIEAPLFVSLDKPFRRLKHSAYGGILRDLGIHAGVKDVHPHRFRRTAATLALNRGMPIDQVQMMLGHESIETTTIYATSALDILKINHRKYLT